jgi:Flp pilus assembly protein TadD
MHYLNRGETHAARNPLLNAQALDPGNPAHCLAIAELKAQASAYEEMKLWADAALERAPDDEEVWKAVARLYLERHLTQDRYPLWAAEGAVRLQPEDGEAHLLLGWAHLQAERPQAAVKALRESVEIAPDSGEAYFLLGQALKAVGDSEQAEQALTHAANLGYISDL